MRRWPSVPWPDVGTRSAVLCHLVWSGCSYESEQVQGSGVSLNATWHDEQIGVSGTSVDEAETRNLILVGDIWTRVTKRGVDLGGPF